MKVSVTFLLLAQLAYIVQATPLPQDENPSIPGGFPIATPTADLLKDEFAPAAATTSAGSSDDQVKAVPATTDAQAKESANTSSPNSSKSPEDKQKVPQTDSGSDNIEKEHKSSEAQPPVQNSQLTPNYPSIKEHSGKFPNIPRHQPSESQSATEPVKSNEVPEPSSSKVASQATARNSPETSHLRDTASSGTTAATQAPGIPSTKVQIAAESDRVTNQPKSEIERNPQQKIPAQHGNLAHKNVQDQGPSAGPSNSNTPSHSEVKIKSDLTKDGESGESPKKTNEKKPQEGSTTTQDTTSTKVPHENNSQDKHDKTVRDDSGAAINKREGMTKKEGENQGVLQKLLKPFRHSSEDSESHNGTKEKLSSPAHTSGHNDDKKKLSSSAHTSGHDHAKEKLRSSADTPSPYSVAEQSRGIHEETRGIYNLMREFENYS